MHTPVITQSPANAQSIARQQVAMARRHLDTIASLGNASFSYKASQNATVLSLQYAMQQYLQAFLPPVISFTGITLADQVGALQQLNKEDYRIAELVALGTAKTSWLYRLIKLSDSLGKNQRDWIEARNKTGLAENLIATTHNEDDQGPHWTEVHPEELARMVDEFEQLIQRHTQFDEES